MDFELLETKRLVLRKLAPEVCHYVFKNYSDDELMQFFGYENKETLKKEKENIIHGIRTYNRTFLYFQMLSKSNNDLLGWCGFHTWYLNHSRAEIGYELFGDEWKGKGFMSEALKPIIDYGFGKMKLNRIEAFTGKENLASMQLLKKNQFVKEGILKEHYFKNDVFEDSILFALIAKDYKLD